MDLKSAFYDRKVLRTGTDLNVRKLIVLAFDALDFNMVRRFRCDNLKQLECGQTDLSDFEMERTVVLWASFLTGRNMESEIPIETQWTYRLKTEDTFLSFFETYKAIDLPAFSMKETNHAKERELMKLYFEKEAGVEEYDSLVWKNHEENKADFFHSLGVFDLVVGYFDLADAIGHLSFGLSDKMEEVYMELETIVRETKSSFTECLLVISDHGMKRLGRYGDHSRNGFYSANRRLGLNLPRPTDFHGLIRKIVSSGEDLGSRVS